MSTMKEGRSALQHPPGAIGMAVGLLLALMSTGCHSRFADALLGYGGGPARYDEETFASKPMPTFSIPAPDGPRDAPPTTVVGRTRHYRVRDGDTLLDIARYHDLGYNEIVQANPGVDPWQPPVGAKILLPTEWILPCCNVDGLIVNIPEMRLYFYRRDPERAHTILVKTHPVGLGRMDWRTPRGTFKVRGKTVDPRWYIPESIRRERIREFGDTRRSIPGGQLDNPLGKYRLELTIAKYAIHGTNLPWGIGRQVSHGCVQLYPEDINRLFPLVKIGTSVEFTYQPVKVGIRDGGVYVEADPDIYAYGLPTRQAILAGLDRYGLTERGKPASISAILDESRGIPVRFSDASGERRSTRQDPDSYRGWRPVQ
jgi:L,D-transpeptidase ErfK/SrfK